MAPLYKAINVQYASSGKDRKTYRGRIDPEWSVGAVPNGGYVLALIVEACIQYQSEVSTHLDALHITAHYLRTSVVADFEVHVRTLKAGRGFTNLTAELIQEGSVKVTTHMIFGINSPAGTPAGQGPRLVLTPPSPYARRIPISTHPALAVRKPLRHTWRFHSHVQWTEEQEYEAKNLPGHPSRTDSDTIGGGGVEWASWLEFMDKDEKITTPYLAFLVDIFLNLPTLLPKSEKVGLTTSWFPTMTLAVEFKAPIPSPSSLHSSRTVGLYSSGKFMNDPQGRHDAYVEVWTAPSDIGRGEVTPGWRDNQVCLATATQMALTIPMRVNQDRAKKAAKL